MTFRSKKLLKLAEGKPCVMCHSTHGVVAAHSNLQEHGKGMGHKAHDGMIAWLCFSCHSEVDQGKNMSKAEKREFMLTAITKTYMELWDRELIGVK